MIFQVPKFPNAALMFYQRIEDDFGGKSGMKKRESGHLGDPGAKWALIIYQEHRMYDETLSPYKLHYACVLTCLNTLS